MVWFLIFGAALIFAFIAHRTTTGSKRAPNAQGRLRGPGAYAFDIVGESHYQSALETICGGRTEYSAEHHCEAVLILENDNAYDNRAVRVDIEGHTVGYLSRENARLYRKQLSKQGHPSLTCVCAAMIVGGWLRAGGDEGHFGVKLDLPVK